MQAVITALRKQDKDRKWRSNLKSAEREVNQLEEDEYQLERVFPQVGRAWWSCGGSLCGSR